MTDTTDNRYTFQTAVRAPFLNVIEAKKVGKRGKENGKPIYSVTALLAADSQDLTQLKAIAAKVAKAQWPGRSFVVNAEDPEDPRNLQFPFVSGEKAAAKAKAEGKDGDFYLGHIVFKATSGEQYPPHLVVPQGGKLVQLTGAEIATTGKAKFYNGCYVGLAVNFKAYMSQKEGGIGAFSGVKAFLSSVVWVKDGPRIGGNATETFRHFAGSVSTENPMGDDVIPY